MKKAIFWILILALVAGCRKDNRERLFEMFYPNFQFTIQAGSSPVLPVSAVLRGVNTNIDFYLSENQLDTTQITAISAISARLTSLNGFKYDFMDFISVRICPDTDEPCIDADEVFYIDRLQFDRPGERIDLLPGLRNIRRDLIRQKYRLEVLMKFAYTPPMEVETRFDMTFQALR
ncbi:MAG: hypothetical protein KDD02_15295 [Phaeodactylibacter sp.]|nr:hypothetical protein [Phaeodactylibacter sp.]MCB0615814.1 hypothetical protein [Phaeodactylibacter sp.]MCB9299578.1 hypothetical protein [Lewinellaceae bacterium]HQU58430.1 hypothetical protein [Saprospiraceae bacterium]